MNVLIKGMVMPKTCQICRTARFDRIVGCEAFDLLSIAERMYKRSPKCPLVEVPTPHGRLIDAAALYKFTCGMDDSVDVLNAILEAPTIIEAEEG